MFTVHLCGENVSPDTWKIRKEDCNVTSTWPVTESFFQNDIFKATGSLWLPEEKKLSNELAKHLNHHQWIFGSYSYANSLNEINIEVSLKNYSANAVKTWLEHGTGTKYCQQAEASATLNILWYFKWCYASINSSGAHPPPPGNCGAFAYVVSPGAPRPTPGHLTHVFLKDGWVYREGRDLCQIPPCPSGTRKTCRCF